MMRQVDLTGLESRINLAGIQNIKVQLSNLRRTPPVLLIRRIGNIMVHIIARYHVRPADHIRMIEPVQCHKLRIAVLLQYMLWQRMQIKSISIFKSRQCDRIFGRKLHRLFIQYLNAFHTLSALFYETIVVYALKRIKHQGWIGDHGTRQFQESELHILRSDRRSIRPRRIFINMNNKIPVIFRCYGIRQHRLKIQFSIEFHKRKELQAYRILINPGLIDRQWIDPSQRIRDTDIHDFLSGCAACMISRSGSSLGSIPGSRAAV